MGKVEEESILLSILIPIYNWDIALLLGKLKKEIIEYGLARVEIVCIDDHSTDVDLRGKNKDYILENENTLIRYEELDRNIGRAKVRNCLVSSSAGQYVLLLDADVLPDDDNFLRQYISCIQTMKCEVVCGGISYKNRILQGKEYEFYHYFSSKNDALPATLRNRNSWQHLLTSNILVKRQTLLETPFDERFTGHGYEDSEWGIRLAKKYNVLHIDNTVSHLGLVSKESVYLRMRASISNYCLLAQMHPMEFKTTKIRRVAVFFSLFNLTVLIYIDKLYCAFYKLCNNNAVLYYVFQINKAVLFSIEKKRGSFI